MQTTTGGVYETMRIKKLVHESIYSDCVIKVSGYVCEGSIVFDAIDKEFYEQLKSLARQYEIKRIEFYDLG